MTKIWLFLYFYFILAIINILKSNHMTDIFWRKIKPYLFFMINFYIYIRSLKIIYRLWKKIFLKKIYYYRSICNKFNFSFSFSRWNTENDESKSTASSNEKSVHSTKTNESVYYVIDRDDQTNMNETIEKLVLREMNKARANEAKQNEQQSGFKKLKIKFMSKLMEKKMREYAAQQQQQQMTAPASRPTAEMGNRKTPTYF